MKYGFPVFYPVDSPSVEGQDLADGSNVLPAVKGVNCSKGLREKCDEMTRTSRAMTGCESVDVFP